jgi:macrolide phosphotransferase
VLERAGREHQILALLNGRLPVAVPNWRIFSPDIIAYPRLVGEPASAVDMEAGGYVWAFDETAPPAAFVT